MIFNNKKDQDNETERKPLKLVIYENGECNILKGCYPEMFVFLEHMLHNSNNGKAEDYIAEVRISNGSEEILLDQGSFQEMKKDLLTATGIVRENYQHFQRMEGRIEEKEYNAISDKFSRSIQLLKRSSQIALYIQDESRREELLKAREGISNCKLTEQDVLEVLNEEFTTDPQTLQCHSETINGLITNFIMGTGLNQFSMTKQTRQFLILSLMYGRAALMAAPDLSHEIEREIEALRDFCKRYYDPE